MQQPEQPEQPSKNSPAVLPAYTRNVMTAFAELSSEDAKSVKSLPGYSSDGFDHDSLYKKEVPL